MIQVHGHKPLLLQYGRLHFPVKPDLFSDEKAGRGLQIGLDVCVWTVFSQDQRLERDTLQINVLLNCSYSRLRSF